MKHLSMAIVVKDGKVLLQERYRASKGLVIEFPGGQVNHNESGTDAAIRELYEETPLRDLTHVATFSDINEYGGRIYYTVLKADAHTEPQVVEDVAQQSFKWLNPSELPLNEFYSADQNFINNQLSDFC